MSANAQGGPPMMTDDPATPGDGMWELNFVSAVETNRIHRAFEMPNVDLNYGLGQHIQLKLEAPWLLARDNKQPIKSGLGNSMVGVKWRFVDEEQHGFDMSIYPQLEFNNPTRSVASGLVDEGMRLFLPIEIAKTVGPVEVNAEVGYRMVRQGSDEWEYGFLVARQMTRRIEILAEVHGYMVRAMREDELFFNAGSRIRLNKNCLILFSAGRTISASGPDGPQYIASLGIQINLKRRVGSALRNR
jgi:hypothetical protein